ncbi:hypothetical protein I3760_03G063600 [Carya illinoinensis]|nr:hypothetical protein I3760_03G063600 [Carya illinoinensis]
MTMFSFSATILSGCVWARKLMMNASIAEMRLKTIASEFCTAITLENFDTSRILIFHEFLKLKENIIKVRF